MLEFHVRDASVEFDVLGASKTVYHVVYPARGELRCSCPDHVIHGNTCKHIYFIMERVLSAKERASSWEDTRNYISSRLAHLSDAGNADVLADPGDVKRYHDIIAGDRDVSSHRNLECGICLTDFTDDQVATRVCKTCLNAVHEVCWQKWSGARTGKSCVYCRSPTVSNELGAKGEHGKWGVQL
jgi:hypothetical protein